MESAQHSGSVYAHQHRHSGGTELQFLSPTILKDGDRSHLRPSPAQHENQQKLIGVIQNALADHDALFDNYFANEGSNQRRTSSGYGNSLSFHANSRPRRGNRDQAAGEGCEEPNSQGTFRKLLFEKVARPEKISAIEEAPTEDQGVDSAALKDQQ